MCLLRIIYRDSNYRPSKVCVVRSNHLPACVGFFSESSAVRTPVLHVFFSPIFLFFFTEKNKYQECLGQELFLETFFWAAVNWLSSLFFGFWFRKRLSATIRLPRTQKPRKEQKKTKKSKDSEECLGQGLCSEALVFFVFFFFGFPRVFLVFGSGGFYRLLRLPKTQKPRKEPKKTKKTKKTKDSEECLGQGLCSEALVFLVFLVFLEFFWFFDPEAFIGY